MAAEASRSGASADSYLGSLISLTSKSEMRYEGVLYNINTDESSIGLSNVRSFGTEGRKKDGPQVPPMDKVFEYILFRGSDIKDLQVKSSPPLQPTPSINNDPAIIQSHYSRPAPTSTTSLPASATGSLSDTSSQNAPTGLPGSNFQSGIPLYQPGGNIGSWGPPPLPNANGSGLGMPMYWQGFYGTSNGLPPHLQQQSLLRPPHGSGLSMPPMQQQMYPGFNIPLPAGTSSFPTINFPSNLPEIPSPLLPPSSTAANLPATSLAPATFPLTLPSTMPPLANASQASETSASLMANKSPNAALPTPALSGSLPVLSPSVISGPDTTFAAPSMPNKANTTFVTTTPYQPVSQSLPSVSILSSPTVPSVSEAPTPSLVTPGQLLQSAPAPVTSLSSQSVHKDVEAVQVSSSSTKAITTEAQPPILPLPTPSRSFQKPNGATFYPRHGYRGRGRGHGSSRPVAKFTEDFDFMAMNEKFNKDEVWGHLGKSKKSNSEEKDEDGKLSDEDEYQEEDDTELSKVEVKAVYNKDDFFDSLSCNALDRDSNTGRPRFSEQMKIDTETFGEFSRYRGGRGGRGPGRGGRFRGSYYGRGYGYGGRGRGRGTPGRAP